PVWRTTSRLGNCMRTAAFGGLQSRAANLWCEAKNGSWIWPNKTPRADWWKPRKALQPPSSRRLWSSINGSDRRFREGSKIEDGGSRIEESVMESSLSRSSCLTLDLHSRSSILNSLRLTFRYS